VSKAEPLLSEHQYFFRVHQLLGDIVPHIKECFQHLGVKRKKKTDWILLSARLVQDGVTIIKTMKLHKCKSPVKSGSNYLIFHLFPCLSFICSKDYTLNDLFKLLLRVSCHSTVLQKQFLALPRTTGQLSSLYS